MQDIYLSLSSNKLRLSTVDSKTGFKSLVVDLTKNVVHNTRIIDVYTFGSILSEAATRLTGLSNKKLLLNVITEPEDSIVSFITISKNELGNEEKILLEIKKKLGDTDLNNIYFSYKRIAPFLYQFVGMEKSVLESWVEVANNINVGLKSLIPWTLLLPRYVNAATPVIFIAKRDEKQIISLSELNGVFYSGVYKEEKSSKELQDFIKELSFYKKSEPLKKVFVLGYGSFALSDFEVTRVDLPVSEINAGDSTGMEINILGNYLLDKDASLVSGQLNLLNLLPVPVMVKKTSPMVYVVPALVAVGVIVVIFVMGFGRNQKVNSSSIAQNTTQTTQSVLGDTQSSSQSATPSGSAPDEPKPVLNRSDLKIRVENGTGVSGLAAKTQDYLKGLGYNVVSIGTADAVRKDTLLSFKSAKITYKDLITTDLTSMVKSVVVEGNLSDSSDYDLLVVLGGI